MEGCMRYKNSYFAICPNCGNIEWLQLNEDFAYGEEESQKVNYLKIDGDIAYQNTYIKLKSKEYLDIVCKTCESPVITIPFEVCDIEQRQKVFKMNLAERILFAKRFEILESLDDDEIE